MRRLVAWIGGTVGGITAYRLLRRRQQPSAESSQPPEPDTRAEELRAKLAETRAPEPAAAPPEEPEPATAEPDPPSDEVAEPESPEERRSRIHAEGRATLDEMKPE